MRAFLLCAIALAAHALSVGAQVSGRDTARMAASAVSDWRTGPDGIARMNLVGGPAPSPTELVAYRLRYPASLAGDSANARVHFHLATEHIIVLRGTLMVGFGDRVDAGAARAYGPEGFVVIPSSKPHFEWTRGETEIEVEAIGPTRTIPFTHPSVPPQTQPPPRDTATTLPNGLSEWRTFPNGMARMNLVGGNPPAPTELIAFRIRYPAGLFSDTSTAKITYHYHFGTEHVTVLQGTLYVGFGDHVDRSKARAYGPGSFIEITAGTPHFEWFGEVEAHVEAIGPLSAVPLDPSTGQPR